MQSLQTRNTMCARKCQLAVQMESPARKAVMLGRSRTSQCMAAGYKTQAMWTRPTPDKNEDWVRPSYIPSPIEEPSIRPSRREEQPLYAPVPEFRPAESPEQGKELPAGPKMPERRPDPIPAGNPKKETPPGENDKREAPPAQPKEGPAKTKE